MEKLFFTEIDSLDNKEGCFASNDYFSQFFDMTKPRCSQIINSLIKKNYVKAKYIKEGKEIKHRVLNIFNRGIKYSKLGIKNIKGGYLENYKGINTKINNTINNTKKDVYAESVTLTEQEYNYLIKKYGNTNTKRFIEKLSNYKGSTGKKYKSDYKAILNWVVGVVNKDKKIVEEVKEHDNLKDQTDKFLSKVKEWREEKN